MAKKDYIQANKDWLAAKATEEGVKPLPKGIYYKVLATGASDGKHPTPRSIVTAHYTGWTINGKKFGVDHQRQEIRQQSWRYTCRFPPERPDRRMDNSHATNVRG